MKKFLLVSCFLLLAAKGFSQQFSQYNTGTLYDSFENPSQRAFVPDTSKMYAFNFFVPNFNAGFFLTGDAQSTLVDRAFGGKYNNSVLEIGNNKFNHVNISGNAYLLMFKMFSSLKGDVELGFFAQTKLEGRGYFSDESIAVFNGPGAFANSTYNDIFNDHYYYQIYNSIGFSYREKVTNRLAIGVKLSALLGIDYNKVDIYQSHINFDNENDAAIISLRGKYYQSKGPGNFDSRSFLPTTRSPGAQISLGTSYRTEDNVTIQVNLKDLGFIHWYSESGVSNFNGTETINGVTTPHREDSIFNQVNNILRSKKVFQSFTTPTNALFELSATKSYWVNDDHSIKYSPTVVVSKELYYTNYTGALVNHFQYKNYHFSLTASYDDMNLFNLGTQFMIKSYNGEFFIGTDKLLKTAALAGATNNYSSYGNSSFTGASFFLGFSLKFGPVIEHPLNASTIPMGEKGFIGRLYNRLFKTYQ
ncbi:DUF5723 family protein [Mucilaginibacter ginsenosidivorans]|uniref:DUF5723 domain-containing protein n=1 Tax=Mucilaginibacter ginsenosidivorans TaxID=398053 RepID=A0A5B8UXV5_9SPHI|nr:DUF5723 family protein [Mucilaginibacter ginsenosidivorans]QEC63809.1 hypothetical protein FRZ54_14920 [Mucilaginibacter ginsenosidivorans]